MKLYRITQNINTWYDTYDSCIVIAENEDEARNNNLTFDDEENSWWSWVKESQKDKLQIKLLWELMGWEETWLILSSFNAG